MTYNCFIYYLHDDFINPALEFLGNKLGKQLNDLPSEAKFEYLVFPIGETDSATVQIIKGLSSASVRGRKPDYAIIEDSLITYETKDNFRYLKTVSPQSVWVLNRRSLEEQ